MWMAPDIWTRGRDMDVKKSKREEREICDDVDDTFGPDMIGDEDGSTAESETR